MTAPAPGPIHRLPASVLFGNAGAELAAGSRALAEGASGLDLAGCADFDSSLIGILLELRRQATSRGQALGLIGPPPNLRKLAQLYGVDALLFGPHEPA